MLGDVGEALGDDLVGGELDRLRPSAIAHDELDGHTGTSCQRLDCDRQTMITDCGRIDPVRQIAQLREAGRDIGNRLLEPRPQVRVVAEIITQLSEL